MSHLEALCRVVEVLQVLLHRGLHRVERVPELVDSLNVLMKPLYVQLVAGLENVQDLEETSLEDMSGGRK